MIQQLFNKKGKDELKKDLLNEKFKRFTLSFYRYVKIDDPAVLRDEFYYNFYHLKILGRVYISKEGINAQISIPQDNEKLLYNYINSQNILKNIHIKQAVQDGQSFHKLIVKVKNEIVAYGINDKEYNMKKVGKHLDPIEFNKAIEDPNSILVDVRNHYESEVGHFKNALIPDVDRSQEILPEIKKLLKGKENKKILLYCTGGIRCEKASSYLIKNNFQDINQLDGGIINYANKIKEKKIKSKYIGKNFVFDDRMGEHITSDVISDCHQCNNKSDSHTNCANNLCHLLFIQCEECGIHYNRCCSIECSDYLQLPDEEKIYRKKDFLSYNDKRLKGRVKPKLYEILN